MRLLVESPKQEPEQSQYYRTAMTTTSESSEDIDPLKFELVPESLSVSTSTHKHI
jgi:hypothetical protein